MPEVASKAPHQLTLERLSEDTLLEESLVEVLEALTPVEPVSSPLSMRELATTRNQRNKRKWLCLLEESPSHSVLVTRMLSIRELRSPFHFGV